MAGGIVWSGIVMIAPPNQGSTVAHQMSGLPGIGKLFQYAPHVSHTHTSAPSIALTVNIGLTILNVNPDMRQHLQIWLPLPSIIQSLLPTFRV